MCDTSGNLEIAMRFVPAVVTAAVTLSLAGVGCGPGIAEGEGEGEEGEGEHGGDGDCPTPATGSSVCDVQDSNSDHAIAVDAEVTIDGAIATSPSYVIDTDNDTGEPKVYGVFIADPASDDRSEDRSGVLVTYFADLVGRPESIAIGDSVTVVGVHDEFSLDAPNTETRIRAISLTVNGAGADLAPVVVTAADLGEDSGEDWEGVLVKIEDVTVTELGSFGEVTLDNGVIFDDAIFHYPAVAGEVIASMTGVVGYNIFEGGGFRLLPRRLEDVESTDRPTNDITDLNDGTITRCAFNEPFNCPAAIGDAVVVSPVVFVNDDNDNFDLFTFWVADSNNLDADGRLQANGGVRVSVKANPANPGDRSGNYTWEQDANNEFLPGAGPEIGDVIELAGFNTEDFDEGEFEASFVNKVTTVVETPAKAVLPALFVGAEAAALAGGRPSFTGDWPGIEDVPAAADIEQWEGALVELQDVVTTNACYAQPTPFNNPDHEGDFGNFLVTGDVELANDFFVDPGIAGFYTNATPNEQRDCAHPRECDSRAADQTFTSLIGIVRFKFGRWDVSPRTSDDVQPQSIFVACP